MCDWNNTGIVLCKLISDPVHPEMQIIKELKTTVHKCPRVSLWRAHIVSVSIGLLQLLWLIWPSLMTHNISLPVYWMMRIMSRSKDCNPLFNTHWDVKQPTEEAQLKIVHLLICSQKNLLIRQIMRVLEMAESPLASHHKPVSDLFSIKNYI